MLQETIIATRNAEVVQTTVNEQPVSQIHRCYLGSRRIGNSNDDRKDVQICLQSTNLNPGIVFTKRCSVMVPQ